MRQDMDKVIVERPRIGSRNRSRKKGYRKYLESTPVDNLPRREPMLGRWRGRGKWLNEHLGPMRRFLRSNVGRPWNKIHQELCEHISFANAVQSHVLDHIYDFVHERVEVVDCSTVFSNQCDWWRGRKLQPGDMYVCPKTGILRTVRRNRRHKPVTKVDQRKLVQYQLRDGTWWQLRLRPVPDHISEQWDVWLEQDVAELSRETLSANYGEELFAFSKRPLNRNEIRQLQKRLRERTR